MAAGERFPGASADVSLTLIFMALTAPVAPACSVTPTASTKIPGINQRLDPSIRIPNLPSMYGGVQTVATGPRSLTG